MQPGDPVHVRMSKWGGRPHWAYDGRWLGSDEHGAWVGFPAGTPHRRPGLAFDSDVDSVALVPRTGWWLAAFHAPGIWCTTYVDVATPAVWDGATLTSVDLDLDVIELEDGRWYVDDEDEFAEHRVSLGYPDDVVAAAEEAARTVLADARAARAPFDGAAAPWLGRIATFT